MGIARVCGDLPGVVDRAQAESNRPEHRGGARRPRRRRRGQAASTDSGADPDRLCRRCPPVVMMDSAELAQVGVTPA